MATSETAPELPFHLKGNYAPVEQEVTAFELPVEGAVPPELAGLFVRNGPNPKSGTSAHWFLGDGMLHGVRLEGGAARWYRNRWVRTKCLDEDRGFIEEDGSIDRSVALANTHVIGHAGRILALVETSFPTEVSGELDTIGIHDYDGRLTTAMTAHPKQCPETGELLFFGYSFAPPYLTYHRVDAAGRLVQSEEIEVPGPTMIHDFAITRSHAVFMDLPVVFDPEQIAGGSLPYRWSDDYGARLGVMPREGGNVDISWHEIEPCYVFHPLNAFEEGGRIVLDVARYPDLWRDGPGSFAEARLHRFVIDPTADKVSEEALDDRVIEFPRVDERRTGLPHRFGYAVQSNQNIAQGSHKIVQYDLTRGATRAHDFGPGRAPAEAVFAPASGTAAEDEGFVLTYVYDEGRNGSELVILDAGRVDGAPLATIRLPQRVPFGFHGSWIPDEA
jgi:carotenoid cleavage dioxygenase